MGAPKGHKAYAGSGRPKGSKDKAAEVRAQFFAALQRVGGQEFIEETAKKEPVQFLRIIANIMPKQLEAEMNVHKHEDTLLELE